MVEIFLCFENFQIRFVDFVDHGYESETKKIKIKIKIKVIIILF